MANNTQRPGAVERLVLDQSATNVRDGLPTPVKIDNLTAVVQTISPPVTLNGTVPETLAFTWSQTGTNAPVINSIIVDDKNIGVGNITPARGGTGFFTFTLSPAGLFPLGGDFTLSSMGVDNNEWHQIGRNNDDSIYIENKNTTTGTNVDGISQYARTVIQFWP